MSVEPVGHRVATISTIERPRLLVRLDAALTHRLTSVIGGPGTGKTTLLAQWAAHHNTVRHTAAPGDSLVGLMQTIVEGIRPELAGIGGELSMAVDGSGLPTTDWDPTRADAVAAALCEHLTRELGTRDLTLIVDDVHLFDDDSDAVDLLAGLVRHAPSVFHLVLASRQELPFPTNRLVIDGLASEVDTADLAFTIDEVNALLGDESEAGARESEELVRRAGGWAIATAFATRIAAQRRGSSTPDSLVVDNERRLFAYFADEVIGGTSDAEIHVLQVAAALPWLTIELADHLELGDPGRRLADRRRASIAMVPVADAPDAVSVAPLVANFWDVRPLHRCLTRTASTASSDAPRPGTKPSAR